MNNQTNGVTNLQSKCKVIITMKKRKNRKKLQENQETLKYNVNMFCIMPDREMDKTMYRIDAHMS